MFLFLLCLCSIKSIHNLYWLRLGQNLFYSIKSPKLLSQGISSVIINFRDYCNTQSNVPIPALCKASLKKVILIGSSIRNRIGMFWVYLNIASKKLGYVKLLIIRCQILIDCKINNKHIVVYFFFIHEPKITFRT